MCDESRKSDLINTCNLSFFYITPRTQFPPFSCPLQICARQTDIEMKGSCQLESYIINVLEHPATFYTVSQTKY